MLYDAFISHASEDKSSFVRELATALHENNVAVWYDEFSLKVGDSLRRSIDLGLSKSRFGIVVLSKTFIEKQWTQWELDGLVQRQNYPGGSPILPVWLDVNYEDVLAFSPPLADRFAIKGSKGVDYVASELLKVIKPQGSSLVVARDRLIEIGFNPPVVTDDWWHQAIEYCGSNPMEGSFQSPMGWGRWGFPLPEDGDTPVERGERIAWAALQLIWQKAAEDQKISQITEPERVHQFIYSIPGLEDSCFAFPHYLSAYAPQLTIPGFGGEFESAFDEWLDNSRKRQAEESASASIGGTALTTDGEVPTCSESIALHDPKFGNYEPGHVACSFVIGHHSGPHILFYEIIDYAVWFLSERSMWMPEPWRAFLTQGMKEWAQWPWFGFSNDLKFLRNESTGALNDAMLKAKSIKTFKLTRRAKADLYTRINYTRQLLGLPEDSDELVCRFLDGGFIDEWFKARQKRKW